MRASMVSVQDATTIIVYGIRNKNCAVDAFLGKTLVLTQYILLDSVARPS